MRDIREIVADVDGYTPDEAEDFDRLEGLVLEYFASEGASTHLEAWFRLDERFPEAEGCGIFWTILHGIEAQPGSDACVVASVLRHPAHFPVLMVNRILNSGVASVGGVELLDLLRSVTRDDRASPDIREQAGDYLASRHGDA